MLTQVVTKITTTIEVGDEGIASIAHAVEVDGGQFAGVAGVQALEAVVASALLSAQTALTDKLPEAYGNALRQNVEGI